MGRFSSGVRAPRGQIERCELTSMLHDLQPDRAGVGPERAQKQAFSITNTQSHTPPRAHWAFSCTSLWKMRRRWQRLARKQARPRADDVTGVVHNSYVVAAARIQLNEGFWSYFQLNRVEGLTEERNISFAFCYPTLVECSVAEFPTSPCLGAERWHSTENKQPSSTLAGILYATKWPPSHCTVLRGLHKK